MKRLISFVLVAALSFFSFIVYAEEPVSPSFLDFPSVLDSYDCSGLSSLSLSVSFNCSGGQGYGSATYQKGSGSALSQGWHIYTGNSQSLGTCTSMDFRLPYKNYYFRQGRIYVLFFSVKRGSEEVSVGNLKIWDSSWSSPFKVISSSPKYICFSPIRDFLATDLRLNLPCSLSGTQLSNDYTQNPPNASYVNSLSVSSFTLQTLEGFLESDADSIIAAIEDQTQHFEDSFSGAVNPGQSGANQEIQDNVGQLEDFDNKIFTDVSQYTSQLDFGLGDWSEAAAGISYIGSIFMLIWDNSPTQVIVLSLMVGLCLLILGRGPRVAGEVRRHEERVSRRKKGG
jgi:hypothetical protein